MESSRIRSIYGGDQIVVKTKSKIEEAINAIFSTDRPWVTIVWDDPVNLMDYVTYVFMELFSYSRERATELMMKVHTEGKAVVSEGTREEMEHDVARLHEYGLWATLQHGDQS
jgi:ATP-dependent Clp protease adaptor protein ClpS